MSADLGIWKTQLNSAHGKTSQVLKLFSSCGESLEGTALGPRGKKEEIDFGHYDGDFLAFVVNVRQPDGRNTKTFFVGKMSKYKIVGTFVDNAGITGDWTAVRMANPPNSDLANYLSRCRDVFVLQPNFSLITN